MKEEFNNLSETTLNAFRTFWNTIAENLPSVLGAVILILIGWGVAKLLSNLVHRVISAMKFDKLKSKLEEHEVMGETEMAVDYKTIISKFVYWVVLLFFFVIASDMLGWDSVSGEIAKIFSYLPKLFSAIIIFVIGMYIAGLVRSLLKSAFTRLQFGGVNVISSVAYYLILIIITVTALNQAGVNTDIISNNISLIIGSVLFAFALGFGIASKDVMNKILNSFYCKQNYEVGQKIKINDISGEIMTITNMSVLIKTSDNEIEAIPTSVFMNSNVSLIMD